MEKQGEETMNSLFTEIHAGLSDEVRLAEYWLRYKVFVDMLKSTDSKDLRGICRMKERTAHYRKLIETLDPTATFGYKAPSVEPCLMCVYFKILNKDLVLFPKTQNYHPLQKLWLYLDRYDILETIITDKILSEKQQAVLYFKKGLIRRYMNQIIGVKNDLLGVRKPLFPIDECKPDHETLLDPIEGDGWFANLVEAPPSTRIEGLIALNLGTPAHT